MQAELGRADVELLIDGLTDDVAFVWVLIDLGIRKNPPASPGPPSRADVDGAFAALERLLHAGLIYVGHMEYVDGGPPNRVAPVKHVQEPIDLVKARVAEACETGSDWEWSCWVVNAAAGSKVARRALGDEQGR